MVNRSVFPSQLDTFVEKSEILASDKANVERYQTLLMQENRTATEETELLNLKNILTTKIVGSEDFNKMFDCISNLQNYFLNSVMTDLEALDVGVLRTDLDNLQAIAQLKKITSDTGQEKIMVTTAVGSILTAILNAGEGVHSFYADGISKNLPVSGRYIRGIAHVTDSTNAWIYAIDSQNNFHTNQYSGTWSGWKSYLSGDAPTWNTLTLQNGAIGMTGRIPRYTIEGKRVTIEGEILNVASGTVIATLPASTSSTPNYRPPSTRSFKTSLNYSNTNDGATIYVHVDGTIVLQVAANTTNTISLMGISYYVD
jgi:hypothetical protein